MIPYCLTPIPNPVVPDGGVVLDEPDTLDDVQRVQSWLRSDLLLHRYINPAFPLPSLAVMSSFSSRIAPVTLHVIRLYLVRDLTDHARRIGFAETDNLLLPVLQSLATDDEHVIRQALAEQLPSFAAYLLQVCFHFTITCPPF